MGSAQAQGDLWSVRAQEWAGLQETSFRPIYEAAFDAVKIREGTSVLDAGCGAGLALEVARSRGAHVNGLDAAPALANIAQRRSPDGDIRVGEIEELPFADGSFDVTTGFNSFQYRPIRSTHSPRRNVSPGKTALLSSWSGARRTNASSRPTSPPSASACHRRRPVLPVRSRSQDPARRKRWSARLD